MERSWYVRFLFVLSLVATAWTFLWPSISSWIPAPPAIMDGVTQRIRPGLDIQGGLRLMYEVEVDEAIRDRRDLRADQMLIQLGTRFGLIGEDEESPTRETLAAVRDKVKITHEENRRIRLQFSNEGDAAKLDNELLDYYGDLSEVARSGGNVVLEVGTDFLERIRETAVDQARETIANRIDSLGLAQAAVTAQDTDIIVEVPGATEAQFDRIRNIIGTTARLEFKILDDEASFVADLTGLPEGIEKQTEAAPAGTQNPQVATQFLVARGEDARKRLTDYVDSLVTNGTLGSDHNLLVGKLDVSDDDEEREQGQVAWRTYYVHARAEVTGQNVEDSFVANDPQTGQPYVAVTFTDDGAKLFRKLTGRNVQRRMSIVLDDRVESAPVIQDEIGKQCRINLGSYQDYNALLNEANDLVIVLKAGALPVPIRPANEQMIGPTLGRDGIENGAFGAMIGVCFVLVFMLFYYQVAGIVANTMVLLNLLFLLGLLAALEATLTLPGVAAIALNVGMAVDANVLINERIREELRNGKSPRAAVDQGFARAFWAIFDSQFTTFLAGVVLYQFGTGPIKGFAVTLILGICTSLFTGIFCSRVFFDWIAKGLRVEKLRMG